VIAYKFLRRDGTGAFTRHPWPLPAGAAPGAWVEAPVDPCRSGIHACRVDDLPLWLGKELFAIELDGEIVAERTKLIASRGRLVRRIDAWDDALGSAFMDDCAERAHALVRAAAPALDHWEADIAPQPGEGPAMLGFVAARIAEERGGPGGYRAERARQVAWLAGRLGL
jgi:hypothetical protein